MQFCEFAQCLEPLLKGPRSKGLYVAWLLDSITDFKDAHFANTKTGAALRSYLTGTRSIHPVAVEAVARLDKNKFAEILSDESQDALDGIYDKLAPSCAKMTPANVAEACADLFADILIAAASGGSAPSGKGPDPKAQEELACLIADAGGVCPRCGAPLIKRGRRRGYSARVVATLPPHIRADYHLLNAYKDALPGCCAEFRDLDSIALCPSCADAYEEGPTPEQYCGLADAWERRQAQARMADKLARNPLDEEIAEVLSGLAANTQPNDADLALQPLALCNKIDNRDWLLRGKVQVYVVSCFGTISRLIGELDKDGALNSGKIAGQVKSCFCELDRMGLSKSEIFAQLTTWIRNGAGTGSQEACEALVAYYIQDCEVFREIPE